MVFVKGVKHKPRKLTEPLDSKTLQIKSQLQMIPALKTIRRLMNQTKNLSVSLQAAQWVLERGFGKLDPPSTNLNATITPSIRISLSSATISEQPSPKATIVEKTGNGSFKQIATAMQREAFTAQCNQRALLNQNKITSELESEFNEVKALVGDDTPTISDGGSGDGGSENENENEIEIDFL